MSIHNTEFLRDPVGFLGSKAIAFSSVGAQSGLNRWVLEAEGDIPPIMLRIAKESDKDTFPAYYLPYQTNSSCQIQLGDQASFMFTPPLTGCTFVIDKKWFTPMVAHYNYQTEKGDIDQDQINQNVRSDFGPATSGKIFVSANYYPVTKSDYVPEDEDAQNHRLYVVGVRGKTGWTMYRMKHDPFSGEIKEAPSKIN
ncbi:hypothetical protein V8J88_24635 [Massilia sp. W12]|uniref:hypothetical protein n=1 Tax=Massilia sp. W12 TaxID=3126507 RepID=UPI0030D1F633